MMKTINQVTVTEESGKERTFEINDGGVYLVTKSDKAYKATGTDRDGKTVFFVVSGGGTGKFTVEKGFDLLKALINTVSSDNERSLVKFDSFEEYLKSRTNNTGTSFEINGETFAYIYA